MPRTTISPRVRFEVFKRDDFKCVYCGASADTAQLHVDHRVPVAEGGADTFENYATACHLCNTGKGPIALHVPGRLPEPPRVVTRLVGPRATLSPVATLLRRAMVSKGLTRPFHVHSAVVAAGADVSLQTTINWLTGKGVDVQHADAVAEVCGVSRDAIILASAGVGDRDEVEDERPWLTARGVESERAAS